MINTTFRRLSDLRNNKELLSSYKYKRENTLRILDFIAFNHCYFCPMSTTEKKPLRSYSWSTCIDSTLKPYQMKNRRHTIALNKIIMRLIRKNQSLNTSDLNRALSLLYLVLGYDSYSINLGESRLFVFDCDVFNHNSTNSADSSSNQFIDSQENNLNFCIGLRKLSKWFIRNNLDLSLLENTYTVLTTSGGLHFYFKLPDNVSSETLSTLKCIGALKVVDTSIKKLKGVCDFLSGNSIVIAPYSIKKKGAKGAKGIIKQYVPIRISIDRAHMGYFSYTTAIEPNRSITALTPELLACIHSRIKDIKRPSQTFNNTGVYKPLIDESFTPTNSENQHAENIYRNQLKKLDECREGERVNTLLKVANTIGALSKYLDSPISLIQTVLINKGLAIGLNERETKDAVRNGLQRGLTLPFNI